MFRYIALRNEDFDEEGTLLKKCSLFVLQGKPSQVLNITL